MDNSTLKYCDEEISIEPFAQLSYLTNEGQIDAQSLLPYNFITFKNRFEAHKEADLYFQFFKQLNATYKHIELKLPFQFNDARPLTWLGFEVTQHYSYLIDLKSASHAIATQDQITLMDFNAENIAQLKPYFNKHHYSVDVLQAQLALLNSLPFRYQLQVMYQQNECCFVQLICSKENDQTLYILNEWNTNQIKTAAYHAKCISYLIQNARTAYQFIDLGIGNTYEEMVFANQWQAQCKSYFKIKNNQ
ncbi:MAG: hypothetical protein RI934_772 [Bacteroidota bacterium]|jgi:hypothetical protein